MIVKYSVFVNLQISVQGDPCPLSVHGKGNFVCFCFYESHGNSFWATDGNENGIIMT